MAAITPSLSTRIDARGKSEILLRFVGGRDHIYRLHSGLFVNPSRWKEGGVVIPRLETTEQAELKALASRLDALVAFLLERFATADKSLLDRRAMQRLVTEFHNPGSSGSPKLIEAMDTYIERQGAKVGSWQRRRYYVTRQALRRWEQYSGRVLLVTAFDKADVREFQAFLEDEHKFAGQKRWAFLYSYMPKGDRPRERGHNTVLQYLSVLRGFFHWARREGLTACDPFDGAGVEAPLYGTPYYITTEELEQLYRADLSKRPGLAVQRDIFVFQCQVGCRVGDLLRFRQEDITDGVLEYIPGKTRGENPRTVRVPLNATAREIMARYRRQAYPRLLPFISSQKYNEAIKDAFRLAGLTRPVTVLDPRTRKEVKRPLDELASSHLARRTFIGNLYKQVKDPNLIASMSGHVEGSRAFARYRAIDDDIKTELVALLDNKTAK